MQSENGWSSEYKRGYSAGYQHKSKGMWPRFLPPTPPMKIVERLFLAAVALQGAVYNELSGLDEDDPWQKKLGDPADEISQTLVAINDWLLAEVDGIAKHEEANNG
jgi:hypothetical protein